MDPNLDKLADAGNGSGSLALPPEVRGKLSRIDEDLRTFVERRPLLALGMAVAAGYLAARLATRVLGR